mgnify:CR=1 FL=1
MQTNRMRRGFVAALAVLALFIVCLGNAFGAAAQTMQVCLGGMPAGFTLGMGGAQVVGICEILTQSGTVCPARDAGLNVGDVIVQFNGMEIRSAEDMDSALACSDGTKAAVLVKNGETRVSKQIVPAKDMTSGKYKLGILIRDSISGIGTVTYIDPQSRRFGSLGHAVSGEDGALMSLVQGGNMYHCSIVSVIRGERGKAGELKGLFLGENRIGTAEKNCETGIYGRFDESYDLSCLQQVPVSGSAAPGKASIYTTINGTSPCEYSISIVKVDAGNGKNKNFVLKVTDERLLSETGGIVQGMSGSPILQGGKLIGAVTHVFLNDPTRGYGIAIERMLANG